MSNSHAFAFSRFGLPEFFERHVPPRREGAGNAGCEARTHGPACKMKKHTSKVTTGEAGNRHSLRDGFNAYSRLSPAIGLFVTVPGRMRRHFCRVDVSVDTSGPHGF